jgi:hypothetical protein
MVEGLSKRITGDWVEIGQAGLSLNGLAEYFDFPAAALASLSKRLSGSVMQGIVEFKESVLQPLFQVLEDMKFKTLGFEELARQKDEVGLLVFVTLIQRLFASGGVKPQEDGEGPAAAADSAVRGDLKAILADVMARVRQEPSLKNNTAVKLILTQLAIYQREREVMEKLKPNIKGKEKAASFRRNFSNTFQKISLNIQKYYREFLEAERLGARTERRTSLGRFSLRELMGLFTKQAREFARVRSTLAFALEQKYKVREICVHLYNEKKGFFALIEQETAACRKLAAGGAGESRDGGHELSLAFSTEIAVLADKLSSREKEWEGAPAGN